MAIDKSGKFSYLDEKSVREPYIYEVLSEIEYQQEQALPGAQVPLATLESLKKSRNIKLPFTPTRDKNIEYLIELLLKNYSDHLRSIISFEFRVDEATKKLSVLETSEYLLDQPFKEYERIQTLRDEKSHENLVSLIKRFRFFNLSRLTKVAKNKKDLLRVIGLAAQGEIFIFKNYSLDKNRYEMEEDFCFHKVNYNSVRDSIDLDKLRDIINRYSELVLRRLKGFGIINAYFSDYRDGKLDYILNIIVNDLASTIPDMDRLEVKNIHSLRSCLIRSEEILDPVMTLSTDVRAYISENPVCTPQDILNAITELNAEHLEKWATNDNLRDLNIISYVSDDGTHFFIDGVKFLRLITDLHALIIVEPERLNELSHQEKTQAGARLDILYRASRQVLSSLDKKKQLKLNDNDVAALKRIISDYEGYQHRLVQREEAAKKLLAPQETRRSILQVIIDFFRGLFSRDSGKIGATVKAGTSAPRPVSRETRQFYKKMSNKNKPVLALSDFIEIIPENEALVDHLINEMREHNMKIVIPIYNAREVLYPKRSAKLLMPDVEYLLVSTGVARSPETVRKFTDSLMGCKVKDEIMPAKSIMAVEKYLLTFYRQRRISVMK